MEDKRIFEQAFKVINGDILIELDWEEYLDSYSWNQMFEIAKKFNEIKSKEVFILIEEFYYEQWKINKEVNRADLLIYLKNKLLKN